MRIGPICIFQTTVVSDDAQKASMYTNLKKTAHFLFPGRETLFTFCLTNRSNISCVFLTVAGCKVPNFHLYKFVGNIPQTGPNGAQRFLRQSSKTSWGLHYKIGYTGTVQNLLVRGLWMSLVSNEDMPLEDDIWKSYTFFVAVINNKFRWEFSIQLSIVVELKVSFDWCLWNSWGADRGA